MISPTLKQLEAFYWTQKLGTFQAASDRLRTTPSALSKRIAELEEMLEVELFDRARKRLRLTQKGHLLVAPAKAMLDLTNDIVGAMGASRVHRGILRLGVTELVSMTWLSDLIEAMKSTYPEVQLEVTVDQGLSILDLLKREELDLVFVPGPLWGEQFESVPLQTLRCCWMGSPARISHDGLHTADDIFAHPVITKNAQSAASILHRWPPGEHRPIRRTDITTNSLPAIAEMTMRGIGLSQLPALFYEPEIRAGRLVCIETSPPLPDLNYFAVHRMLPATSLVAEVAALAAGLCDFARPM